MFSSVKWQMVNGSTCHISLTLFSLHCNSAFIHSKSNPSANDKQSHPDCIYRRPPGPGKSLKITKHFKLVARRKEEMYSFPTVRSLMHNWCNSIRSILQHLSSVPFPRAIRWSSSYSTHQDEIGTFFSFRQSSVLDNSFVFGNYFLFYLNCFLWNHTE